MSAPLINTTMRGTKLDADLLWVGMQRLALFAEKFMSRISFILASPSMNGDTKMGEKEPTKKWDTREVTGLMSRGNNRGDVFGGGV
jgi:hypothetical protein